MHRYMPNKWYIPENTKADHRRWLQAAGYSRGVAEYLANSYVWADYKRYCDFGESWWMESWHLTMYVDGIKIADDWLGGIESDGDAAYNKDILDDMKCGLLHEMPRYLDEATERINYELATISALREGWAIA